MNLDSQVKCLKSSVFKCRDDIFRINILVMFITFVFKISMEFSIVSMGKSLQYDYEKCLSLTFQSQNSSKVNGVFIVPFLPAFYQVLVTFFFVCVCVFFLLFLFSWACFSWKKTNGKCEEGCLWTWQEQLSTMACAHANPNACVCVCFSERTQMCTSVFQFVCVYGFVHGHVYMHVCISMCICVCRCICVSQRRCSAGSGKV